MKTFFKTSLIIITSYLFYFEPRAQESDYFEYQNEILWGINKNTNGGLIGGINLKFGNKIKDNTSLNLIWDSSGPANRIYFIYTNWSGGSDLQKVTLLK